jgi:hypothetical protein
MFSPTDLNPRKALKHSQALIKLFKLLSETLKDQVLKDLYVGKHVETCPDPEANSLNHDLNSIA